MAVRKATMILAPFFLLILWGFRSDESGIGATEYWVVEKNSTLAIKGSSNISPFRCDVQRYLNNDTLRFFTDERTRKLHFNSRSVTIDIQDIDCHHRFITSDLRKTLRYDDFPHLKIHFITLEDPSQLKAGQTLKGLVDIELAGRLKRIDMEYTMQSQAGRFFHLVGNRNLLFSDFRLDPPKKLAGLIHINENINVSFQLFFRRIG